MTAAAAAAAAAVAACTMNAALAGITSGTLLYQRVEIVQQGISNLLHYETITQRIG